MPYRYRHAESSHDDHRYAITYTSMGDVFRVFWPVGPTPGDTIIAFDLDCCQSFELYNNLQGMSWSTLVRICKPFWIKDDYLQQLFNMLGSPDLDNANYTIMSINNTIDKMMEIIPEEPPLSPKYRRNADENLRKLERKAASGDPEAQLRLLHHKVRTGLIQPHAIILAKYLGDPLATTMTDETWEYPFGFPDMALWGTDDDPDKSTWEPTRQNRSGWALRGRNLRRPPSRSTYTPVGRALTHPDLDSKLLMALAADCAQRVINQEKKKIYNTSAEEFRYGNYKKWEEWRAYSLSQIESCERALDAALAWAAGEDRKPRIEDFLVTFANKVGNSASWDKVTTASVIDAALSSNRRIRWSHITDVLEASIRGLIGPGRSSSRDEVAWQQQRLINYLLDYPQPPTRS